MLTDDYIKSIVAELINKDVQDVLPHIHYAEGYDGVITVLDNIRTISYPCFIIEDRSFGQVLIDSGPIDLYSLPIWIMVQKVDSSKRDLYSDAFDLLMNTLKLLLRDAQLGIISGLNSSRFSYNKRSAADACGYELLLNFNVNIDLSYE